MHSKIYELYLSYKDRELDDAFFNKALDIFLRKDRTINPYIKDFQIINTSDDIIGSYSNENRIMKVNKLFINNLEDSPRNIVGLQTLQHELNHAKNLQTLEQRKKDIESRVILYSLRTFALLNKLDYMPDMDEIHMLMLILNISENYETNPGERIADIKAWKYIVNLLKNQKYTDDLLYAKTMLYNAYIRGYKNNRYYIDCPTFSFLLNTRQFYDLSKLKDDVNQKEYSLDTRLMCGLPISNNEYNDEILKKLKLKKKTLNN